MLKNVFAFVTRKSFMLVALFLIVAANSAISQIDIAIGTATTTNTATGYPCPLPDNSEGSRAQYLFRAAELKSAGMDSGTIYSLKFNVRNKNAFSGFVDSLVIKMANVTNTVIATNAWIPGANQVYGPVNYVPDTGINVLTLSSPFVWDGVSNLLIEICTGDPANNTGVFSSGNVSITYSVPSPSFNASHTYVANNLGNLCNTATTTNSGTATNRPNVIFSWVPKLVCSGTPVVGTATAAPNNVCPGINFTLTVGGITPATGYSYQWEMSPDGVNNWDTVPNSNKFTITKTQNVTTYYRFKLLCTNSNDSVYSNVVTVTTPTLLSGNYTIDKTAPPSATNFISFNAAYNAMKCGIAGPVVFDVLNGPYSEQLIINGVIPFSSQVNTITFKGNGNTIQFASTATAERAVIKLKNTKCFIFDSLTVDASVGTYGIGFHLTNNADTNTIKNCTIISSPSNTTAGNTAGVAISGADNNAAGLGLTLCDVNTIINNTIKGGYYGITLTADFVGGANGTNNIINNTIQDFYRYGIYVNGSYNCEIGRNKISRPTRVNVAAFDGIYFTGQSNNTHVFRNRIFAPFKAAPTSTNAFIGINLDNAGASATNDYKIDNNLIYGVVSNGAQTGFNNNGSGNAQYVHNTVALDDNTSAATVATKAFSQSGTANSIVVVNNIFSVSRGGTGTKHCLTVTTLPVFADNNVYDMSAAIGTNYIGAFSGNRLTLTDWQNATVLDAASLDVQPVFYLPGTADTSNYSPTNAAMDNKGFPIAITYDINDSTRDANTPDIGCYEFVPPPCAPGSLNGTTTIRIGGKKIAGDTTVCEGTFAKLSVDVVGPFGSAQTFQWEIVKDLAATPAPFGNAMPLPDTTFQTNDTTYYYRCKISCLGVDYFTNWRKLNSISAMPTGDYYINSNYPFPALMDSDYVPGVSGAHFKNYRSAVYNMRYCGIKGTGNVVFRVDPASGPYEEQVKIDSVGGATAERRVVFKGNNTTVKFPAAGPTANERAVIKLTRADYINFDSVYVDANTTSSFAIGIHILNNADTNSIKNCVITSNQTQAGNGFTGIMLNANDIGATTTGNGLCDANLIDNNTISGGYYGIVLTGGSNTSPQIENDTITNNKILDFYNTGLLLISTRGAFVNGNTFSRPNRTAVGVGTGIGLATTASLSTIISNNRFTSFYGGQPAGTTGTYGINMNSVDATPGNEIYVFNNAFYNLDGAGFVYALYNTGSDNVFYYHNSIAIDNPTVSSTAAAAGFYQTTLATGLQFKNNIVHITRGGTGVKHCINLNTAATGPNIESNTNVLYVDGNVTNGHIGNLNGNKTTMAAWKAARAPQIDSASFNYDPLYTNPTVGNLKPQFYLIDNKGENFGIPTDIVGVTRPTATGATPDIGAWEFTAPLCPTPLLAGTASVTPSSGICLEAPIQLSLAGNSPVGQINFQWQDSIAGGSWQNLGPLKFSPVYDTISSIRNYYRCIVTCAATGASVISTVAKETLNDLLPAGTYTINNTIPTDPSPHVPGHNFNSFADAIAAMQCGILGSVVFDVDKGTGSYNEQVRVPYVPGTAANKTITFQGNGGYAPDKLITWSSLDALNNYVLRFDSCSYVTFKDLTIENTNTTNGRVVDFVNKASNDRLLTCIIKSPLTTGSTTTQAAVYSSPTKGINLTIKGNTIIGGSNGIYFAGTNNSATGLTIPGHVIDSNSIKQNYAAGIFVQYTNRMVVTRNTIAYEGPSANLASGIYASYCDTAFLVKNNKITINNIDAATLGISLINCRTRIDTLLTNVDGNTVYANNGNTGKVTGISIASSDGINVKNNVVGINSADSTGAYGLLHNNNTSQVLYYNNTVSVTTAGTKTAAAQLTQTATGKFTLINNIFTNSGGGRAMFQSNLNNFTSNYNMLYVTGSTMVTAATANYSALKAWYDASGRDKWSINYAPALVNPQDLRPNLKNPDVWAIHGRGVQITGNSTDINDKPRPETLLAGVPDLGAYEFYPDTLPTVLAAVPATPALAAAQKVEQIFYYGSDTVMRIKWDSTNIPPSVEIRRYSGVVDSFLRKQGRGDTMFFYTQVTTPNGGNYSANVKLHYLEPWLGNIPHYGSEYQMGLGKTTSGGSWAVGFGSRNNVPIKQVYENNVTYLDKFTGLFNQYAPPPPPCSENSNEGTEFWTAYPANQLNGGSNELYLLYLSAKQASYVTVSIPCLNWVRTYNIPAGTVQVSAQIPYAAREQNSGLSCKGIHIVSDNPIVAYAHCSGSASSGATMLMPTCTWGYEYKMLARHQNWGGGSFSSYFVIAKEDNTKISLNNVVSPSSVPQTGEIVLNTGEWYQVLAASGNDDLSGSVAVSVPNDQGKCLPFAMFSGDTRTLNSIPCGGGGDFAISQNFPASAWGKKYLTAPTSRSTSAGELQQNLFRIALKDVNQKIWINNTLVFTGGTVATTGGFGFSNVNASATIIPGTTTPAFVEFRADSASYVYSDRPMMIAQFLSGACSGVGDPDMVFISPMEQGINKISFYRNTVEGIDVNVLTLIGASNNVPSICEVNTPLGPCVSTNWNKIYPHPNYPGKSVYIKHWPTAAARQVTVQGDSAFTAITYGLGSVESYCYNAGTLINNIGAIGDTIKNFGGDPLSPDTVSQYTCAKTKFKIGTVFPLLPDSITWKISSIPGISPNADITLKKPYGSAQSFYLKPNGDSVFIITIPDYYTIAEGGFYTLIVKWWHPDIEGCDKKREDQQFIQVVPYPKIGFSYNPNPICPNTLVNFVADTFEVSTGIKVRRWGWTSNPYGINTGTLNTNTTSHFYATAGVDTVKLRYQMRDNFCIGDSSLLITINPNPVVEVVSDSINVCSGATDSIRILNPIAGATYSVFATATGGTSLFSGDGTTPFGIVNITADADYYIEAVSATGCVSVDRKKVRFRVTQIPTATATPASIIACIGTAATFNVLNPVSGGVYTWYDAATAGNVAGTGNSLNINPVTADAAYYLEVAINGCVSTARFPVALTAATTPSLAVVSNTITVCSGDAATFNILNPDATVTYNWYTTATGGTATNGSSYTISPATASASYFVSATSANGCTSSPRLQVDLTVNARPVAIVVAPTDVAICKGSTHSFAIQNPIAGATYNWYNAATGANVIGTGVTFTTPVVTGAATYYVDGTNNGCTSVTRAAVKVDTLVVVDTFTVTATQNLTNEIIYTWRNTVAGANGFEISIDGANYIPVSGPGSQHLLSPLPSGVTRKATVRAIGANICQDRISDTAIGKTVINSSYYPNVFSPNGNGDPRNEYISICGISVKELKYMVFNQWGQKIWETNSAVQDAFGCYKLWNGTHNGVLQPTGVYVFASRIVYLDGRVEEKKGTINLIR